MIKNFKIKIKNCSQGFTLIETLVVLGIASILMVGVGGIMTSSFRVKNSTEVTETVQNEAYSILSLLKKNVLDADTDNITCPLLIGSSMSFVTKGGGHTILWCDDITGTVASVSAQSGTFNLISDDVSVQNCSNFVECSFNDEQKVATVDFTLDIGVTGGANGNQFWKYVGKVVPR